MSKKLAEGSRALLLDVKCGAGAFMKDLPSARTLAALMVETGRRAGVRTEALITCMDAPLGRAVGNAVEIEECVRLLQGAGPADLTALVVALAVRMVDLAERGGGDTEATVRRALDSGAALDVLRRMIEAHGGDAGVVDDPGRLPRAQQRAVVLASRSGYVTALDAGRLGNAAVVLGAGRDRAGERIDHGPGILMAEAARPGDPIAAGDPVLELLYNDAGRLALAEPIARSAVSIGDAPPPPYTLLLDEVR
jgi:thymidine phosphorylase